VGIVSIFAKPHAGQVMTDSSRMLAMVDALSSLVIGNDMSRQVAGVLVGTEQEG